MISKLSAKYQFCAIHTAHNTDGKVTIVRRFEKVHRLDPPHFPCVFRMRHYKNPLVGVVAGSSKIS